MSRMSELHIQAGALLEEAADEAIRKGYWLGLVDARKEWESLSNLVDLYRDRWGDDPDDDWIHAATLGYEPTAEGYRYTQAAEVLEVLARHPDTDVRCALHAASLLAHAEAADLPVPDVEPDSDNGVKLSWPIKDGVVSITASVMDDELDGDYCSIYLDHHEGFGGEHKHRSHNCDTNSAEAIRMAREILTQEIPEAQNE